MQRFQSSGGFGSEGGVTGGGLNVVGAFLSTAMIGLASLLVSALVVGAVALFSGSGEAGGGISLGRGDGPARTASDKMSIRSLAKRRRRQGRADGAIWAVVQASRETLESVLEIAMPETPPETGSSPTPAPLPEQSNLAALQTSLEMAQAPHTLATIAPAAASATVSDAVPADTELSAVPGQSPDRTAQTIDRTDALPRRSLAVFIRVDSIRPRLAAGRLEGISWPGRQVNPVYGLLNSESSQTCLPLSSRYS